MPDMNKATYVEELETVWRPHKDAPSLLGNQYCGSTLTGVVVETSKQIRNRRAWTKRRSPYKRRYRGQW